MNKISGAVFIKNTIEGAYCLFESVATMLPLLDDLHILDLGSNDGTKEHLDYIASKNSKIKIHSGSFPDKVDANDFATLANEVIGLCHHNNVIYWQSDEIWHEDLLKRFKISLDQGAKELIFWRIQYRENFQKIKWLPHSVHRFGQKDNFNFVGDGMNTDRYLDPPICSEYDMGNFTKWGEWYKDPKYGPAYIDEHTYDMIMDVSQVGAFRDNIVDRRRHHAPFWKESVNVEGVDPDTWLWREKDNPNWTNLESPFNLPHIMKYHIGKVKYVVRPELIEGIANNNTLPFLGLENL